MLIEIDNSHGILTMGLELIAFSPLGHHLPCLVTSLVNVTVNNGERIPKYDINFAFF